MAQAEQQIDSPTKPPTGGLPVFLMWPLMSELQELSSSVGGCLQGFACVALSSASINVYLHFANNAKYPPVINVER